MNDQREPAPRSTVKQTIVETIEAPRLENFEVPELVIFKEKRLVYERRVAQKNEDRSVNIPLTTYRDSVSENVLRMFVTAKWIQADSVQEMTEEQLRDCIEQRGRVHESEYNLANVERKLAKVALGRPKKGVTLETQVWRLCMKYYDTLKACGYDNFIEYKPKIAVSHIYKRLSHTHVMNKVRMALRLRRDKFEKDFSLFMRTVAVEAKAIDEHDSTSQNPSANASDYEGDSFSDSDSYCAKPQRTKKNKRKGSRGRSKNNGPGSSNDKNLTDNRENSVPERGQKHRLESRGKRPPKCLNPKCKEYHFIKDCPITSEEEKSNLKEEYHEGKRRKRQGSFTGKISKISTDSIDGHSSLFSASFCKGAVEAVEMADQGSDANIISPSDLRSITEADQSIKPIPLKKIHTFSNALQSAKPIRCCTTVQATVRLRVRHGNSLTLENIKWFVSEDELECIYIGRHVLAALGLDNRKLLAIASDRNHGFVDVKEALKELGQPNEACAGVAARSIGSIMAAGSDDSGSTLHEKGDDGPDALENTDVYVDLGEDDPVELETALDGLVEKARVNGISGKSCEKLLHLVQDYCLIFASGWENSHQPTLNQCG